MLKKILFIIFLIFISAVNPLKAQTPFQITLSTTAPEAGLFFSNPGYITPALAEGPCGIFSNPAALGFRPNYGIAFSWGIPSKPKINSDLTLFQQTTYMSQVTVPLELTIEDKGGFNFLGLMGHVGPVGLGAGLMQKSASGLSFNFQQSQTININYQITQIIRARINPTLDTAIPITVDVNAPVQLTLSGNGGVDIGRLPLFFGAGYALGENISFGLGAKLYQYSGTLNSDINLNFRTNVSCIGRANPPFRGAVTGHALVTDTILRVLGTGDFNTTQLAFSLGALVRAGFFKMGLTFEKGLSSELAGSYSLNTVRLTNMPDSMRVDSNYVNFILPDSIYGRLAISVLPGQHDHVTIGGPQTLTLRGYNELNLGLSLSIFDLYLGARIPNPHDVNNVKLGLMFSVPVSPVTIRTGVLVSMDYLYNINNNTPILPLRVPIYAGLGASYNLKLNFLEGRLSFLPALPDAQIDFAVKTNALPWGAKFIPNNSLVSNIQSPGVMSLLSFNFGLGLKI
ncbi:MAG: hypothetical protein NZ601_03985 [candidate division WOR-3 bacterium]|nr:hypothetical protein [candidate division WOR-3 bacterium]MDW7987971.1 hypothetical protein [candidate division WOR-3 bacterium]